MKWNSLVGGEIGQEEEGLIKKHCFEWTGVNRRMRCYQAADGQARKRAVRSFVRGIWAERLLRRRGWGTTWERDVKSGPSRL